MAFDLDAALEEAKSRLIPALMGRGAHLTFEEAIDGFPASLMNVTPANVPYTFWHQLEHMRIAQWDILEYIRNPRHVSPDWPLGYWPDRDAAAGSSGWDRTIALFTSDRRELVELISDRGCNIFAPVDHMGGHSILREVLLVIDHTAYHLGEFVMARQILGAWKSALG